MGSTFSTVLTVLLAALLAINVWVRGRDNKGEWL
jgi:hypothetical protein